MDKIYIKDLEIYANHGVFQEEKKLGQKFLISIELELNLRKAAITKDLTKSIDYGRLCCEVEEEFKKESYDLIETAAEKISEFILEKYDIVKKVKIVLKKPWAPIGKPLDYAAVEINRKWHKAYIGLGSNIGDKNKNLSDAIQKIDESKYCRVIKKSSFIVTPPWGYTDQDEFLNGVIEVETTLEPKELVVFLLNIEKELKRERIIKWGPRTIDLDVLLYDDIISDDEEIVVPHPRMHERMFVLEPLSEIAPYKIHPLLKERIIDIKKKLEK
ncbi:2-amino-4-hydroxy-6-hydroxymethyldihydropteridine diphosphokinase [Haloimpatiens sp. FM7330]|uniref:2-amino-4-hydroxy-6- hydroxymethyldihydropteridine diphosphokinase n=1 Tax=Haloimpatiens sp. FM7330 TaxID=3298610 RepID=UPI00363973EC